jgi:hypothetical protein
MAGFLLLFVHYIAIAGLQVVAAYVKVCIPRGFELQNFEITSKSGRDCDFAQSTFLKVPGVVVVEVEEDTLFLYRDI